MDDSNNSSSPGKAEKPTPNHSDDAAPSTDSPNAPEEPGRATTWSIAVIVSKLAFVVAPSMISQLALEWARGVSHSWTYKTPAEPFALLARVPPPSDTPSPCPAPRTRNVVILGASWGGAGVARALGKRIPSGWRVVVVEKNEAYHHLWNFPRYTALPPHPSHAARAFVPYDGLKAAFPPGALAWVTGEATRVVAAEGEGPRGYVELATGEAVPYDYLVVATGADNSRLDARTTTHGIAELAKKAAAVQAAKRILVLGGGAVGVELATDLRSQYGDAKTVTLVHSRARLLERQGPQLHARALAKCAELGVRVVLGERPEGGVDMAPGKITLPGSGEEIEYDLFVKCVRGGSQRATAALRTLLPASSFNERDGRLRTSKALQVLDCKYGEVFALGDAVDVDAPNVSKMARAAHFQSKVVAENVIRLIRHEGHGKPHLQPYIPVYGEDSIKLTLGFKEACMWMHAGKHEWAYMMPLKSLDLDAKFAWDQWGVGSQYPEIEDESGEHKVVPATA